MDGMEKTRRKLKGESMTMSVKTSVDWRGRPCKANKHGGMTAAIFVLSLQAFEMMAIAAVGNNLITYVFNDMHFPLSKSANIVTNFIGTVFLLSLLGFYTVVSPSSSPPAEATPLQHGLGWRQLLRGQGLQGFDILSGTLLGGFRKWVPETQHNLSWGGPVQKGGLQAVQEALLLLQCRLLRLLYGGACCTHSSCLGPNAFWDGCRFRSLSCSHGYGLDQLDFRYPCLYEQTPRGSIFTPIAQVFVAAITKRKQICPSNSGMLHGSQLPEHALASSNVRNLLHTEKFRFLDKACIKVQDGTQTSESPWRLCTVTQVEQVKIIISVVPIFACTIIFNTILAQLQTFSVQQGSAMNTRLIKGFEIPPASLQSIPYLMLIFLVPLYETVFVPIARKITGRDSGISPLQRIGIGLFVATLSMVSAALVEKKRRTSALDSNRILSIFWIAPQFLIFGLSEMFTAVGLIEFFYKQSVEGMQSFLTAMTYCSRGWLGDNDLNKDRLDLFYWLLAALSLINFFNYLFWSRWYSYNPSLSPTSQHGSYAEDLENHSLNSSKQIAADNNIP
ncbi:Protein NRT1/ PTR family 4.3 [Vitis vinifera]|uniref:Protein NRT1/ PTR family 4.3 n=1 Tax=Vitis vinifera TaxID=29760 RepID=A0A438D8M6_VITVI|nr:Protein NRT1/ PTR family 4.3 [Vitis vinifera]